MILPPSLTALVVSLSAWLGAAFDAAAEPRQVVQRMIVRDEIIIHVPIAQRRLPAVRMGRAQGAQMPFGGDDRRGGDGQPVDASTSCLRDRRRVRAQLDSDCAGLDFYGGFYVEPRDGAVCAKREEIRVARRLDLPDRALPKPRAQGTSARLSLTFCLLRVSRAGGRCDVFARPSFFSGTLHVLCRSRPFRSLAARRHRFAATTSRPRSRRARSRRC